MLKVVVAGVLAAPRAVWSAARARALYRHGLYVTAIAGLTGLAFGVDVVLLHHATDAGAAGTYAVYNGLPKRVLGVVFAEGIGLVLLPTLALLDKPTLLRRIGRLAPAVAVAAAALSFVASAVVLYGLRDQYPYSFGLMALAAVGIGVHTVFNLYFFALCMDGVRGARSLIRALLWGVPIVLAIQWALISAAGLIGGLVAFAATNVVLVGLVVRTASRTYRAVPSPEAVA